MHMNKEIYDIAIIGSGPAGLSASIYASRYKLTNIVFGKVSGGTITEGHKICNYPGYEDISGMELGMKMFNHAKKEGGQTSTESIVDIKKEEDVFKLLTDTNKEYFSKTLLLATGTERNELALASGGRYLGKGLSYCATCDGMFYRGKTVAVVGGSSSATMSAVMLSDLAEKVYIIYRGEELRGEPAWAEQAKSTENVEVIYSTVVKELFGEDRLEGVKLSTPYKGSEELKIEGLFVEIGSQPNIALANELGVEVDDSNYIIVDKEQKTNVEGVWSAGDCTTNSNQFKQAVVAAGEGAIAASSIYRYLKSLA